MKILFVPWKGDPEVMEIEGDELSLEKAQELVGGYVEQVYLQDGVVLLCDEDAKMKGARTNRSLPPFVKGRAGQFVAGDFILVGVKRRGGRWYGLEDKQLEEYGQIFA